MRFFRWKWTSACRAFEKRGADASIDLSSSGWHCFRAVEVHAARTSRACEGWGLYRAAAHSPPDVIL